MSRYKFIEYGLCITLFFVTIIPLTLKYKYYGYNLSDFQMYVQNVPIYKYLLGGLLIDILFMAVLIIRQLALPNITEQELQQARKNKTIDLFTLVLLIGQNFYQIYRFDLMIKSIITTIVIYYVDQINYLFKNRINIIQIQISQLPNFKRNKKQYVNIIIDHIQLLRCVIIQILFFYLELKNVLGDDIKKFNFEYLYTLTQYQFQFLNIIFTQIIEFIKNLIKLFISPVVYFYQEDLQNISIIGKITDFIIQLTYFLGSSYFIADQILIVNQKYTIYQYIQKYIIKKYKKQDQKMQIRKTKLGKVFIFFAIIQQLEMLHATVKTYNQMKLSLKSYRKLQNFPEPSLQELYNESDEEKIRKHKHKYLSETLCSICLNEMDLLDGTEAIRKLPCGHCYHLHCIRQWINEGKNQCPVCNKQIFEQDLQQQLEQLQDQENEEQNLQNLINQQEEILKNKNEENKQKDNQQILEEINKLQEQKKENNQIIQNNDNNQENNDNDKHDIQQDENQYEEIKQSKQQDNIQEIQTEQNVQNEDKLIDNKFVEENLNQEQQQQQDQTDEQIFAQLLLGQEEIEKESNQDQEQQQQEKQQIQEEQVKQQVEIEQKEEQKEQLQKQEEQSNQQQIQQDIQNIQNQEEQTQEEYVQPKNILYAANAQKLFKLQFCTQQNVEKLDLDLLIKECDVQYQQFKDLLKQAQENQYNYKLQLELYKLIQKQQK